MRPPPPGAVEGTPPLLLDYLRTIVAVETRGDATEESFYPALQRLLDRYAEESGRRGSRATVLPRRTAGCALDLQVWRHDGSGLVGYVEATRPGPDRECAAGSPQLQRYLETFPNLLLTNLHQFRLFRNGAEIGRAAVEGGPLLRYYVEKLEEVGGADEAALLALLDRFFAFATPRPGGASVLAAELAKRARILELLIEEIMAEGGEGAAGLSDAFEAFKLYLIRGLKPREFADLYAQTVAYGLLAARWNAPGDFERRTVLANVPRSHGILRDVFRYLLLEDPRPRVAWIVDDIVDLLSGAPVRAILDRYFHENLGGDPMIQFYETFLVEYDHDLRASRGVYYTPPQVVSYIVRSVHEVLRARLGRDDGLADPGVTILDPAAGTLTFLVEVFREAIRAYREAHGEAGVPALLRDHLLRHCF